MRDARSKGVPQLGSGAIYPIEESFITVPDMEIPSHWARAFALDASPLRKASIHAAHDRESGVIYIYAVWKRERVEPAVHAEAIKALGDWIPGVGDASGMVADSDRRRYIDVYRTMGLDLELATKGVESGIQRTWVALSQGGLKVFESCRQWFDEFRLYRRDEQGRIVKDNDDLLDCTQYLISSGVNRMITKPVAPLPNEEEFPYRDYHGHGTWMR